MAAALMERRGQTVDAISIYEEVAARFPADAAGQRATARLTELRPNDDKRKLPLKPAAHERDTYAEA